MIRNIITKIRFRKLTTILALFLVLGFAALAIFTNILGRAPGSKADAITISDPNDYYLDGYRLDNDNPLGRVTAVSDGSLDPRDNINGKNVVVGKNPITNVSSAIRMDNTVTSNLNSSISYNALNFITIGGGFNSPSMYGSVRPTGSTHLNSLIVENGASVTSTPLDFIGTSFALKRTNADAFGVVWTGYYTNAQDNPDLEFSFVADGGAQVEVCYDGVSTANTCSNSDWKRITTNGYYSSSNTTGPVGAAEGTLLKIQHYIKNTYLPIRIYYNNPGGTAAFHLFVKSDDGKWYVPQVGVSGKAGKFYTGPNEYFHEGLEADYYLNIANNDYKYKPTQNFYSNPYVISSTDTYGAHLSWPDDPASTTMTNNDRALFRMSNYYYSFIDTSYSHTFNDDRNRYPGHNSTCNLKLNYGADNNKYANTTAINGDYNSSCYGIGGIFINKDDSFGRFGLGIDYDGNFTAGYGLVRLNLAPGDPINDARVLGPEGWMGGNSRLNLQVDGDISITNGSGIDASASGWPGGILYVRTDATVGLDGFTKCNSGSGCTDAYGMGPGGGAPNYNGTGNNGVAAGGAYGGYGSDDEYYDWRGDITHIMGRWTRSASLSNRVKYGSETDVEYSGSGGGSAERSSHSGAGWDSISGSGGGNISISAHDIIMSATAKITANGGQGRNNGGDGSGGGIHLNFTSSKTNFLEQKPIVTANGAYHWTNPNGRGGGGRIYFQGSFVGSIASNLSGLVDGAKSYNVSAQAGGCGITSCYLWPTGATYSYYPQNGTFYISTRRNYSMKKILQPIERPEGTAVLFNPYELMEGDIIRAVITVENPTKGDIIQDNLLEGSGYICMPYNNVISDSGKYRTENGEKFVEWILTATSDISKDLSYQCKVQKK